jgi:hypothetical protein
MKKCGENLEFCIIRDNNGLEDMTVSEIDNSNFK